ncbi:hypothetical protein [Opitutus sp. ER46]|uniref:ABC transporter permease n=1 Tax=Opitutus sp. ER46 TaxID=2161864 RepID=UPI000D31C0FE|nr:hypothetical protein [Opitutus sp. ER46]PTX91020.1 hypothetical protein DB354_20475 [Opitutus sp. ER46]
MDATLDLSRWRETPRGVGYRRWSILRSGLDLLLRNRFYRILLGAAWSSGLMIAVLGFTFSQAISSGGVLESLATRLGPRFEAIVTALSGFVALYPDICIGGIFGLIFWVHSFVGLFLALLALTGMIPRLITHDRASNALVIYLARPLTTTDYLLGKLGMIVGMILLVWTGPLLFGWLVSMLFATNTDFIWYSLEPLGRALLFNGISLVALAAIALGVSALGKTSRMTTGVWIALWFVASALAAPPGAPAWLKRASFTHDLKQVRQEVLRIDTALTRAGAELPLLDRHFAANLSAAGRRAAAEDVGGALAGLGVFVVLSSFVFFRRLKPEGDR